MPPICLLYFCCDVYESLVQREPFLMSLEGSGGCSEMAAPAAFPFPGHAFISIPSSPIIISDASCTHLSLVFRDIISPAKGEVPMLGSWQRALLQGKNPQ